MSADGADQKPTAEGQTGAIDPERTLSVSTNRKRADIVGPAVGSTGWANDLLATVRSSLSVAYPGINDLLDVIYVPHEPDLGFFLFRF
jgi:hypothetical protein